MQRINPRQGGMQACEDCGSTFEITKEDLAFLDRISPVFSGKKFVIPPPTSCPDCRQQRRLMWRNERNLYKRPCNLCNKPVVSIYAEKSPFPVYCPECWRSDAWHPSSFGREFDFNRTLFEQMKELQQKVPRISLSAISNENSEYVNLTGYAKNCYLLFASDYDEDCLYGTQVIKSTGCIDALNCFESQYCFDVADVEKSHRLFFSKNCSNCTDSYFLSDCRGCSDCILSINLRNKRHVVRNRQLSPAEYEKEKNRLLTKLGTGGLPGLREEFARLDEQAIHRFASILNCENVSGDHLTNSRNLRHCFDVSYGEDCSCVYTGFTIKDLQDVCHTTEAELGYESTSLGFGSYNTVFTHGSWSSKNLIYCDIVQSGTDMIGCVSMKPGKYCILNKQYSKEEYEMLAPKVLEHVQKTGEWGRFFPKELSPFAYNETNAQLYFPLSKGEAIAKGYRWKEEDEPMPNVKKTIPAAKLPQSSADVPDDILEWAVVCEATGKPFRIVKPELDFYRKQSLPLPRLHPDERHRRRMALRNPRKLFLRKCDKCSKEIETTYAPTRPEKVYCEECYLAQVY